MAFLSISNLSARISVFRKNNNCSPEMCIQDPEAVLVVHFWEIALGKYVFNFLYGKACLITYGLN